MSKVSNPSSFSTSSTALLDSVLHLPLSDGTQQGKDAVRTNMARVAVAAGELRFDRQRAARELLQSALPTVGSRSLVGRRIQNALSPSANAVREFQDILRDHPLTMGHALLRAAERDLASGRGQRTAQSFARVANSTQVDFTLQLLDPSVARHALNRRVAVALVDEIDQHFRQPIQTRAGLSPDVQRAAQERIRTHVTDRARSTTNDVVVIAELLTDRTYQGPIVGALIAVARDPSLRQPDDGAVSEQLAIVAAEPEAFGVAAAQAAATLIASARGAEQMSGGGLV